MIDSHFHAWQHDMKELAWLRSPELRAIDRDFDIREYAGLTSAAGVEGGILVTAAHVARETVGLLKSAANDHVVVGVVGGIDLASNTVETELSALLNAEGGRKLVGIRHAAIDDVDNSLSDVRRCHRGLAALIDNDLALELLLRPDQLLSAARLSSDWPNLTVVIDHLGNPSVDDFDDEWEEWIGAFTDKSSVLVKISGLVTLSSSRVVDRDVLQRYVDVAVSVFGPRRLMVGSDWPVATLAMDYGPVMDLYRSLFGRLDEVVRDTVLNVTPMLAYRPRELGRNT